MSAIGKLKTLLGLDSVSALYALAVDENGYLMLSFPGQAGGGTKRNPVGDLISPVGISPSGLLKNLQVDAGGNLIITLLGGTANQIVKSDGTDAEWDDLLDIINALKLNARARVYNGSDIATASGVWKFLTFGSERYDTDAIHSVVSDTNQLVCKTAGNYSISGGAAFEANAVGIRQLTIRINGSTYIALNRQQATTGAEEDHLSIETKYDLAVNDYAELGAYQASGGALDIKAYGNWSPEFMMTRIG